ncbi:MAG: preQ(1) synthase [Actinomycetota bacterium]|nr:preQ(1) synthase [Actinomycetota bacterium]
MTESSGLSHLGSKGTTYNYDSPSAGILEVFPDPHPGTPYVIGLDCFEFTSLCPVTGQPDYGRIWIDYVPEGLCVESKSLKLYMVSYRNHGAFHEACVNSIADDLVSRLSPLYLRVFGDFNARGGIAIRPMAIRWKAGVPADVRGEVESTVAAYDRLARRLS